MTPSPTHVVLLPTYNTGPRLLGVVREVLRHWQPVLVVVDGSNDGSEQPLHALVPREQGLSVLVLPHNSGKGAAVLAGLRHLQTRGLTHALVMDADGQHSATHIAEFMAASLAQPEAMILGRPVFGPEVPLERLHGRKLSVGMVRCLLLGAGVDDPLFGFRVYPISRLLDILGPRRGGRRYDFDTEAAVRLAWAGVRPVNLAAPVRYFTRAEGGVSHFHYVRDNLTLVWMHLRLLTELILLRWPALLRHRRRWRTMVLVVGLISMLPLGAAEPAPLVAPANRLASDDPAWRDLHAEVQRRADAAAGFEEHRWFSFKKAPTVLKGEVRVSAARGLSLHYLEPQERTVIIDDRGLLLREAAVDTTPPSDPRATAANLAMLHLMRFDLRALAETFDLYGERTATAWTLALVPRDESLRRTLGQITVTGESAVVRRIELRRSLTQRVEILIEPPRPPAPFTESETRRFFR